MIGSFDDFNIVQLKSELTANINKPVIAYITGLSH